MYHSFYNFKFDPFNLTPNSQFFFESTKHKEALSTLLYAIQARKGFVVVTGDIGAGKTTVCRKLMNRLDYKTQTALITNTHIGGKDLLSSVLEELDVEYTPGSKSKLLLQLNEYLIEQLRNDNNVVLIIDEAQNLKPAVLEEVRMLSNLETEQEKLIQIIFLGQPELKKKLALAKLEQLRQRIAFFYHLKPLSQEESKEYIRHRLSIASEGSDREYFTEEALGYVYDYSKGIPRLINQICDSALLNGFLYEREVVDKTLMCEVIDESPVMQIMSSIKKKEEDLPQIVQTQKPSTPQENTSMPSENEERIGL